MASPVIVYIRRLEKGTNTVGRRPTPKPSLWHTNGDWSNQDLYAREIYVNTAEGKAFITNDTDIFNLARDDGQQDYVSGNTLTLEDVFFHKITNNSNEIRLINNFIETYFKWRGGSSIVLEVLTGETVKHLYAANGNAKPIKLACGNDYTATQDILIQLVYDEVDLIWKEIGSSTTLWKTDGTYTTLTTPQPIRLSKSLQEGQSANIAVVNDTILPANGNYCSFTGTGTINRISKYDANGIEFQGGTAYDLYVLAGMTIKHNYTSNNQTTYKKILIDAQQDWTASTDTLIHMRYDSLLEAWVVSGTATGDILKDSTNILAIPMQANGYNVVAAGNITGWLTDELTGCTVTNVGGATVSINANTYISFGAGDLYGIKVYNSSNELIHELACCENNVNVPYLHCSVTGRIFYITNVKTVIKQDTYFKCKENGWQRVTITESGDIMDVAYKNDKTKIYE